MHWAREGEILRCPWHGWEFDIASGRACVFPEKGIKSYAVSIEDGKVIIEGV